MLDRYKVQNLYTMLNVLENTCPEVLKISSSSAQVIRSQLKQKLMKLSVQNRINIQYQLILELSHKQVIKVRIMDYFTNLRWSQYLPEEVRGITPRLTFKYVKTLGRRVFNYTHFRKLTSEDVEVILRSQ